MNERRSARPIAMVLLSAGLLSGGCSRPASSSLPLESASQSPPIETPSATPPSESLVVEPPMPLPPNASIAVEGGDPVVGQLGTFIWENGGTDAPWLDGSPIHVGVGEELTLMLAESVPVGDWSVSRVPPGNRDGIGAVAMGEGSGEPISFGAPPSGRWSVAVSIQFAEEQGSGLYFWLIEVD